MAGKASLTIACDDYDRTRAIRDGRVAIEGCDVTWLTLGPKEMFERAFRFAEFDISELSFNTYMMTTARGTCPYIAIPAFTCRVFRHSMAYIRTDRGIRGPADLKGKLVGIDEYQQTANVWLRGTFEEEYGLRPAEVRWRRGRPAERTPLELPHGVEVEQIPAGETLDRMLASGALDAAFSPLELSCFTQGAPHVGRLFPDFRKVEQAYYRKTRIFPIMHLVGIRKTLAEKHPWLAANVYRAFREAKEVAVQEGRRMGSPPAMLPWYEAERADTIELMGKDYWRYGVAESAHEIETLARYSWDQGLLPRRLTVEELFAPTTL